MTHLDLSKLAQLCQTAIDAPTWHAKEFRDVASPALVSLLVSVAQAAEKWAEAGEVRGSMSKRFAARSQAEDALAAAIDALRGRVGK